PLVLQISVAHSALHYFPPRRSSDLAAERNLSRKSRSDERARVPGGRSGPSRRHGAPAARRPRDLRAGRRARGGRAGQGSPCPFRDRKSTRLNSSHVKISYAVFCLKK